MEPPSPLISWVNPLPSRFINRMACFPWKVSYFPESRRYVTVKIIKLDEVELRSLPFVCFPLLLTMCPFLRFYSHWDLGIMKQKFMNYPAETKHEAMGQRQRTENHGKVIFASLLFWLSYIPNVSKHFEKSRQLSVLWTIWNFLMINAEKVQGSFDFCHHRGVDFAS